MSSSRRWTCWYRVGKRSLLWGIHTLILFDEKGSITPPFFWKSIRVWIPQQRPYADSESTNSATWGRHDGKRVLAEWSGFKKDEANTFWISRKMFVIGQHIVSMNRFFLKSRHRQRRSALRTVLIKCKDSNDICLLLDANNCKVGGSVTSCTDRR